MIRIAIASEDKNSQKKISEYIKQYSRIRNISVEIAIYAPLELLLLFVIRIRVHAD